LDDLLLKGDKTLLSDREFIKQSLDINLFFLRIMKEHAYFLDISLPEKYEDIKKEAKLFINIFNNLLIKTVHLSQGVVGLENYMVTEYTLNAEKASELLTGAPIDRNITRLQMQLGNKNTQYNPMLVQNVYMLNCKILEEVRQMIYYKTNLLNSILSCKVFSTNYPSLVEHLVEEAQSYYNILIKLQNKIDPYTISQTPIQEAFWNEIMGEHAKFIRGLLDPSHEDLINMANEFAIEFEELREQALDAAQRADMINEVTEESLEVTTDLKEFKTEAIHNILDCKISIIAVPLLADHVLREANHYLQLLQIYENQL